MEQKAHWESVYTAKAPDQVSWYAPHLDTSLTLIDHLALNHSAAILDVGSGGSTLVDDLLQRGYRDISLLDISHEAQRVTSHRLGASATHIHWLTGDVCSIPLKPARYDLWHDRAVFHFFTQPEQRTAYVQQATQALKPHGHIILGVFGPEGPTRCSGLDVLRYDAPSLESTFGDHFELLNSQIVSHAGPTGSQQQFIYAVFKKRQ
jgi:SAM-dependent methyltransferase